MDGALIQDLVWRHPIQKLLVKGQPWGNRTTWKRHQNTREKARRLRQAADGRLNDSTVNPGRRHGGRRLFFSEAFNRLVERLQLERAGLVQPALTIRRLRDGE